MVHIDCGTTCDIAVIRAAVTLLYFSFLFFLLFLVPKSCLPWSTTVCSSPVPPAVLSPLRQRLAHRRRVVVRLQRKKNCAHSTSGIHMWRRTVSESFVTPFLHCPLGLWAAVCCALAPANTLAGYARGQMPQARERMITTGNEHEPFLGEPDPLIGQIHKSQP